MRKIETEMNDAISEKRDWKCDNTEVLTTNDVSTVLLHGNKIAEVEGERKKLRDRKNRFAVKLDVT